MAAIRVCLNVKVLIMASHDDDDDRPLTPEEEAEELRLLYEEEAAVLREYDAYLLANGMTPPIRDPNHNQRNQEIIDSLTPIEYYSVTPEDIHQLIRTNYSAHWYKSQKGDPSSGTHVHRVLFREGDESFNLDGTGWKSVNDPENVSFVLSVKNLRIPDEFEPDGLYHIMVKYVKPDYEVDPYDFRVPPGPLKFAGHYELDPDTDEEVVDLW